MSGFKTTTCPVCGYEKAQDLGQGKVGCPGCCMQWNPAATDIEKLKGCDVVFDDDASFRIVPGRAFSSREEALQTVVGSLEEKRRDIGKALRKARALLSKQDSGKAQP